MQTCKIRWWCSSAAIVTLKKMISAAMNKNATSSHWNKTATVTMRPESRCMSRELFHRLDSRINISNRRKHTRRIEETRMVLQVLRRGKGTDLSKKSRGKRRRSMSVTCRTLRGSWSSAKRAWKGQRPKTSCKMARRRRSLVPSRTRPISPC